MSSDLASLVSAIPRLYPAKRAVVAFPHGHHSGGLHQTAVASFSIGRHVSRDSQLPQRVTAVTGFAVPRPWEALGIAWM